MAISPIGNITYINQNTQVNVANLRNNESMPIINQEFKDKINEIQEVRPTEETNTINKDSKKENKQSFQEKNTKEQDNKEEIEKQNYSSEHILDIKA
ncbi:hypothetical protein LW135_03905 [Helicobacter sp. faydin-H20]|uniref:hypothetical protein n=1 Tax=Helicobacter anatolicus TaxID=2905874 RepID=UPI001E2EE548|nr:hypothetical protein [Helicobacter anatolicus]MCE3036972.1 hypothetical protein [Helicobacter anatolicus]